jgi:hypothetical protein
MMAITKEDYLRLRAEAGVAETQLLAERSALHQAESQAAAELLSDPKWKVYADQLEEARQSIANRQRSIESRLTDPLHPVPQDKYINVVAELAFTKGYVKALTDAIESVKALASQT